MTKVSKPMKLITLRIGEEEKARLEQLAEQGDVTLSRALREGAALYLSDRRAKAHRTMGGDGTYLGIRRDQQGRVLNKPSKPTAGELARARSLRNALHESGLGSIRHAWSSGVEPSVVLGSLGQWLSLVGEIYASNPTDVGWYWFVRDYCPLYSDRDSAVRLCKQVKGALIETPALDVGALLDTINTGLVRFLEDVEHQDLVRREVLPAWSLLERGVSA